MVSFDKVMRGVNTYLDREIFSKMGWQKWLLGTGIGLYTSNAEEIYNELKENALVKMLGIITEDNMIDIDKVHNELVNQARKGAVHIDLPLSMGKITLTDRDVDLLHQYINNA